jgi:hypothetical protein
MKTTTLKTGFHIVMISAFIITSIIVTKNVIQNIKHLYGLEANGKAITCFFDMIQ